MSDWWAAARAAFEALDLPLTDVTAACIAEIRTRSSADPSQLVWASEFLCEDFLVDRTDLSGQIPVSWMRTRATDAESEPRPIIVYVHGGGMISGDRFAELDVPLEWAHAIGASVVTLDYRLAPEHPDPAPRDDCWAVLRSVTDMASSLGFSRDKIFIAGSSAGAGLAAGLAIRARDEQLNVAGAMLLAPMLDDAALFDAERLQRTAGNDALTWTAISNETAWNALLGTKRFATTPSPYAVPARASDLGRTAPTYIDVGTQDLFHEQAIRFAERLSASSVPTHLVEWPAVFHGLDILAPSSPLTRRMQAERISWLRTRILEIDA